MLGPITPDVIGSFVDSVVEDAKKNTDNRIDRRTPEAVAGRFIEEAVELCLAAGVSPEKVMSHVMDSIHNQVGKAGRRAGRVIYPSYYKEEATPEELAEEMADCSILLKDLAFITGVDIPAEEERKWAVFTSRRFDVSEHGTLYSIK